MHICREARKKERLEREVKELKGALESRQAEIRSKQAAATQAEEQVQRLEQMLKEAQVSVVGSDKSGDAKSCCAICAVIQESWLMLAHHPVLC